MSRVITATHLREVNGQGSARPAEQLGECVCVETGPGFLHMGMK